MLRRTITIFFCPFPLITISLFPLLLCSSFYFVCFFLFYFLSPPFFITPVRLSSLFHFSFLTVCFLITPFVSSLLRFLQVFTRSPLAATLSELGRSFKRRQLYFIIITQRRRWGRLLEHGTSGYKERIKECQVTKIKNRTGHLQHEINYQMKRKDSIK